MKWLLFFAIGVILAFPLAIVICSGLGYVLRRIGTRCPGCGKCGLELRSAVRSYPHPSPCFYKCRCCGQRYKRLFNGPWEDASAVEFDGKYDPDTLGLGKRRPNR